MAAARENSRLILQSDWEESLREPDSTAWVSYKKIGETSIHGELTCHGLASNGNPYVTATQGFNIHNVSKRNIDVSYEDGHQLCRSKFQAPSVTFSTVHQKTVSCLDVTNGGLAVSCDTDGQMCVWTTEQGDIRRKLSGHLGDVYTCQFFPSGLVVLSGGGDCQLKVWSAETGQCAVTMTGHKAGIMDTAVVDRGRNVVSVSRDGSAKLWDCGQSSCLATFSEVGGVINACAVGVTGQDVHLGQSSQEHSDREVLTEGKMLLVAVENETLQGYGLHSRDKVFEMNCGSAVNCCTFVSETLAACGTQDGRLFLVDLRNTESPLQQIKESRSAILSMLPYQQGVFVSTGDGSCFLMNETFGTSVELTGPDCDAVYKVASDGTHVYTACRDGAIRKYRMQP